MGLKPKAKGKMAVNKRLLMIADASQSIGSGHVMRCLALAQEWLARGGQPALAAKHVTAEAADRLEAAGVQLVRRSDVGSKFAQMIEEFDPSWIIIDVGRDSPAVNLSRPGRLVLVLDDLGLGFLPDPDLVLNQNWHAATVAYSGIPASRLLRGLRYVLLRDEYVGARGRSFRNVGLERRLQGADAPPSALLVLGSTDPLKRLVPITEQLLGLGDSGLLRHLHVVVSSGHAHLNALSRIGRGCRYISVHVDVLEMPRLLAGVDLAISSGGSTVWELAYMGVPALVVGSSAMEVPLVATIEDVCGFKGAGALSEIDDAALVCKVANAAADGTWRRSAALRSSTLVDGRGRVRVVDAMLKCLPRSGL